MYKVEHVLMNKIYALKTLHAKLATTNAMLRLRKEAQAASNLEHPNLVRAYHFGLIDDAHPYIVMDMIEGPTLAQLLKEKASLSVSEALKIFIPVCRAMAYAHKCGVIHRDIKPSNIMLASDASGTGNVIPKVVDFGIAKTQLAGEAEAMTLTKTGEVFGTPLYMSPEQSMGSGVDERSDIYALGCVIFESLTGAPPFQGDSALETMMQHVTKSAPSLLEASLGATFPPDLECIVAKMLAKELRDRYQNFDDVASDLAAVEKGESIDQKMIARPGQSKGARSKPGLNTPAIAVVAGGLVLIAGILGVLVYNKFQHSAESHPNSVANIKQDVSVETESMPQTTVSRSTGGYFREGPNEIFHFPKRAQKVAI